MAIEIVPKPKLRAKAGISLFDALYYLVIFLLIVTFLSYFVLNFLSQSVQKELKEIETAISQKQTKEIKMLEERVLASGDKIDVFSVLLNFHTRTSTFFNFLREHCHKKVFFSKIDLDVEESEVLLSGTAESFRALGEQTLIFKKQYLVKNVFLSAASMGREGGIEFELTLFLDPNIFK